MSNQLTEERLETAELCRCLDAVICSTRLLYAKPSPIFTTTIASTSTSNSSITWDNHTTKSSKVEIRISKICWNWSTQVGYHHLHSTSCSQLRRELRQLKPVTILLKDWACIELWTSGPKSNKPGTILDTWWLHWCLPPSIWNAPKSTHWLPNHHTSMSWPSHGPTLLVYTSLESRDVMTR